ncbi:glycosyltransferase family 2 protein [Leifsonia sp. 2MCAF36]|uniref:glycosyltransferase family 2 protein n=1 Tax=Leifsonia sp. 2MCAF36 TaxID=3232988 RepID=UPI003F9BE25E
MTLGPVSVVLCTHNGESVVGEQIRSILGQTTPVSQIVLSDDASSDGTVDRARREVSAAGSGVELTVIQNPVALGVTGNFAAALGRATEAAIALCDQDDVWHPDKVDRVTTALEQTDALLVWTDARLVDGDGAPLGRTLFGDLELSTTERSLVETGRGFEALLRRNLATGATVMLRSALLEYAQPIPAEWVHDEWLAIIASAVGGVSVLDEATIDYRQHGGNQIGVTAPTLRYKVRRVLEPRGERNELLARKFAVLADRLAGLGDAVPRAYVTAAVGKAAFERTRADLPTSRLRRLPAVAALLRSGGYDRFASQGRRDAVRDLLQSHRAAL